MLVVGGLVDLYEYKFWESSKTNKLVKVFDTSDESCESIVLSQLFNIMKGNPTIEVFNNCSIQQVVKHGISRYAQSTANRYKKIGTYDEATDSVTLDKLALQPLVYLRGYWDRQKHSWEYTSNGLLTLPDAKIWLSEGTGMRGQPKNHLLIWHQDRLHIINYDLLRSRGIIQYRNAENTAWFVKKLPTEFDLAGFQHTDRNGNIKQGVYCVPSLLYKKEGRLWLEIAWLDLYDNNGKDDVNYFGFYVDELDSPICTNSQFITMYMGYGRDSYRITGFKNW